MRLRIVVRGAVRAQRIPSVLSAIRRLSRNGLRGKLVNSNLLEADFWLVIPGWAILVLSQERKQGRLRHKRLHCSSVKSHEWHIAC
jgi:hypothetical protein